MKKFFNYTSVVGIMATVLFIGSSFKTEIGPKVPCPSGDKFKCVKSPNGTIVYKGDGEVVVDF